MTWFKFLTAVTVLCLSSTSLMAAAAEPFRIRSASIKPAGEVSAIVELPPESTPKSSDFQLLIDDSIAATARETQDQRLNLLFLVDVSGSMKGAPLNDAKAALSAFLAKTRPQDQFALVSFADEDEVQASLTDQRAKLEEAVRNLRVQGKRTKLYQALYKSLKISPKSDPQQRQIIVVVSDGKDEGSEVSLEQVIAASKESLVPIYAVFRGEIDRSFADVLAGLANAAGGNFFSTRNQDEIAAALERIYRSETNSVALRFAYEPDNSGRATENAAIQLLQPDGSALRAALGEKIPALAPVVPLRRFPLWLIFLLLALLLGATAFWIYHRSPKPEPVPTIPSTVDFEREPEPEIPSPMPPSHRATTVIGQYFRAPATGQPTAILRGVAGPVEGWQRGVEKEIFSIGATAQNDLPIREDEYVSGEHAYLRYEKGSLFVFDKASRNGTFVNDDKVPQTGIVLHAGDRIKLGMSTFEVVMPSG
jgi:Mg-chelatase subunit ChlD